MDPVAHFDQEIARCKHNINLALKNWATNKSTGKYDDAHMVAGLSRHALLMADLDGFPAEEFLAAHLAVAIKMLYEERNHGGI